MKGRYWQPKNGYTLLEMLVVLVVIGLIVGIAAPQLFKLLGGARNDAAALQIKALETSLDYYQLDVGAYPTNEQGLDALLRAPDGIEGWDGPYVKKAASLTDPWGERYKYRIPGEHGEAYDLYTLGSDKAEGGSDDAQDVGNWE